MSCTKSQAVWDRYFVHELTSEVNSSKRCVTKIMAMSGTRKIVAHLCMCGLAACDEGGRKRTESHQCALECGCTENAQARIDTLVFVRTAQARIWSKQEHGYIKLPEQWRNS